MVDKFADEIVGSVIGEIAEDQVRENVDAYRPQSSGQNTETNSFSIWDIAAYTISIVAFFIGLFGLIYNQVNQSTQTAVHPFFLV